ncbi:MAG: GntR family transcriptional regulator [Roseovarius sp.]
MATDRKRHCLEALRMRILRQDIAPGADLDEAALCAEYGLSRTPMREIFHTLEGEGYVTRQGHRGVKVASMDLPTLRTFFQTAPLVYANIARLAAENRRDEEIAPLAAVQAQFRAAAEAGDAGGAALLNHRFHALIGEMAHNPYLLASLNRMLIDHTRLSHTFYRPRSEDEEARVRRAIDHHDEMIAAIEAREPERAVALTIDHWQLSRDRLERFVTPDPLPLEVLTHKDRRHAV